MFTVPIGGGGFYYFYTYLNGDYVEYASFNMLLNGSTICSGEGDQQNGIISEQVQMACGAVVRVVEGSILK